MKSLEAMMKKHNISIDYFSYNSYSHGHALSSPGFSFNETFTHYSYEWLVDFGSSYHMAKDKAKFSTLNECNTKKIFFGDDRSLSVEGSGTIQVKKMAISMMSYVFQVFIVTFYQYIKSLIQVKVKP